MTTVKSRGARNVAPISNMNQATPAAPTAQAARVASPIDDDTRVEMLAARVACGGTLSETARDWLRGRGSVAEAPMGVARDLGLIGGDFHALAQAALEQDDSRRELVALAARIASGQSRLDEASRPAFLSRIRLLRGGVHPQIRQSLDLAETAGWPLVAERLEESMAKGRAR